jgi:hypothetical protein
MTPLIETRRQEIAEVCRRFAVRRLDIFGSGARGTDFDADFLVEFEPDRDSLASYVDFKEALENLLHRPVDLVERGAVEASRNYTRRRRILREAEPVYDG